MFTLQNIEMASLMFAASPLTLLKYNPWAIKGYKVDVTRFVSRAVATDDFE